ncbi:hypothetical protein GCM10010468_33180 [Actinocorallia longicatena]|uniref:Mannosyltransferase PIG-V n=1 Tax=Actinocorallia longicatena TaxID=111803 RepID=A0ABP6QB43_9ACTN
MAWFSIVVIRVVPHEGVWPDYLARWNQWDADRFRWLAMYGYDGGPPGVYTRPEEWPAFFPGYPMAVRFVGFVFTDYRAAGLVVSLISGAIAAVALARLGDHPSTLPRTYRRLTGGDTLDRLTAPHIDDDLTGGRSSHRRLADVEGYGSGAFGSLRSDDGRSDDGRPTAGRSTAQAGAEQSGRPAALGTSDPSGRLAERAAPDASGRLAEHASPEAQGRLEKLTAGTSGRFAGDDGEDQGSSEASGRERRGGSRGGWGASGSPGRFGDGFGRNGLGGNEFAVAGVAGTGERWRGPGFFAVLALVVSPCAVFLFAAYSEALFLALAVPAWLLAKKGRWELAVLCAAGASIVRITGLFLAIALIVEFLVGENGRKGPNGWRNAPYLITPFLSISAYMAYQWHRTGDWLAWMHAQKTGWNRSIVPPWKSFQTTWDAAFNIESEWTNAFRVEIFAAGVGVVLVAWLLYQAQWGEAVYVGSQLGALMVSEYYLSIGRATLVWFPLWLTLGHLAVRHRWLYGLYLALAVPVMAAFVLSFTQGQWSG